MLACGDGHEMQSLDDRSSIRIDESMTRALCVAGDSILLSTYTGDSRSR